MTSTSPAPSNLHDVQGTEHFQKLLSEDLQRVSLLNFWAPWAEPCKQMNEVVLELAKKFPSLLVLQIDAESQPDISDSFEVESVPSFVLLRGHTLLDRVAGADASKLATLITKHVRSPPTTSVQSHTDKSPAAPTENADSQEELDKRLVGLMKQDKVVLFMKGSPDAPRCGFSRRIVALLKDQDVTFTHFDILTDESVRAGLKVLNNWPTFPQLIINGEFVGGLDVVTEMVDNGELQELVA